MDVHMTIADLTTLQGRQASIRFADVDIRPIQQQCNDHPCLSILKIGDADISADNSSLPLLHSKVTLNRKRNGAALLALLNPTAPGKDLTDHRQASANAGDTFAVADETFSDTEEIGCHSRNVFLSLVFQYPTASLDRTFQFMQLSCPNLKSNDGLFTQQGVAVYDRIDLVSGICLFNGAIMKASISGTGGVDSSILDTGPTLQESEHMARSSSAIADLAAMLISRSRERRSEVRISIGLDIPSFHYYHSVIELFERGRCTASTALEWMNAVDLRHDQIAKVYVGLVQYELERRGISSDYEIHVSPKSNFAARLVRKCLQHGQCISFEAALRGLDDESDGLWRKFYQHVATRERPGNWEELGYLSYVFEVVRPAFETPRTRVDKVSSTCQKPRRLMVSIDDAAERRIYSKAQEILKRIRSSALETTRPTLMEIYLCRRVFVNNNKVRARLYHHDPTPETPVLVTEARKEDCPIKPLDVIQRLYGAPAAGRLHSLYAKVGL
ncbi:MAG: hypothetical protein Q9226_003356 [Calogaya cf. arnoldii]